MEKLDMHEARTVKIFIDRYGLCKKRFSDSDNKKGALEQIR